ncbi:hypothetical protein [Rugamonas rivuli]|uniref:Lipoprotein n=1 Tax=Rugamonas rivuli TaxID=2743358 RepID=A0A843SBS9_9BURK|nr:hypothetical protein [Rugamonas rivuli]MQA21679.1 hypothetical protein [Rugamonas rivuli]
MKRNYLLSLIVVCAGAIGCPQVGMSASQELTIPNFDPDSPACVVKLPDTPTQCTVESCKLPLLKGSTLEALQLNFSCLPKSAPTGFENPAPEVKVQSIRAKNSKGHVSLMDDVQSAPAERLRELNFCLYGKLNNFCGNAKVLRLKDGAKLDGTNTVKAFIQGMELQNEISK